tara:strand:+ start:2074 stop:2655 length:582 start_codon:yes stop_codon:yes gene_type:complete
MPGFRVGSEGGNNDTWGIGLSDKFHYTYTWKIDQLLGEISNQTTNRVHAKDVSLPALNVSLERYVASSLEYKFAKHVSFDDVKITFYDAVGLYKKLRKWRESVYTWQEGVRTAEEYKKYSSIEIYDPTWEDAGVNSDAYRYDLIGSWPSKIRHGDLTYTSSDVKVVEVTLTYDYAVIQPIGASGTFKSDEIPG